MSHHAICRFEASGKCGWSIMSVIRLDTDVLMAESTLVTVLGGLAVALGQESVAAREHRRFIVEMLSALTAGPGASDHLWAANGDWVIVVTSAPR